MRRPAVIVTGEGEMPQWEVAEGTAHHPPARTPTAGIRLGVVCDPRGVAPWQARCVRAMAGVRGAALEFVFFASGQNAPQGDAAIERLHASGLDSQLSRIAADFRRAQTPGEPALWRGPAGMAGQAVEQADLVLWLLDTPPGPAPGGMSPRHGIWHIELGDSNAAPGVFEVLQRRATIRLSILRYTAAASPDVIDQAEVSIRPGRFSSTIEQLHVLAAGRSSQLLSRIAGGEPLEGVAAETAPQDRSAIPSLAEKMRFYGHLAKQTGNRVYSTLFRHTQWTIGVAPVPVIDFLKRNNDSPIAWISQKGADVKADPFAVEVDGRSYILYEHLVYRTGKKQIAWMELDGSGKVVSEGMTRGLPDYSSYPFLFRDGGQLYCMPEAHRSGEISLYVPEDFPSRWRKHRTLIGNLAALDPTLVFFEGLWWLFFTKLSEGGNDRLHCFYASTLDGPWMPHRLNPVKTDSSSARPAGTPFIFEGKLLRPAQDCSRKYGERVVLNEIRRLSPDAFEEVEVTALGPSGSWGYRDGMHTLSGEGKLTVFDARRKRFSAWALIARIRRARSRGGAGGE